MAQLVRKQDLPPPGGYKPIPYARIPAKTYAGGFAMIAGFIGISFGSCCLYVLNHRRITREKIEMRSAIMAIAPLLLAERDRTFLKQLIKNREEETELMKDVEGWEVGTWYGEPIYRTLPPDTFFNPYFYEFYAHADEKTVKHRVEMKFWT